LQHIMTKLKASNVNWQFSEVDLFNKKLDWTRKMIKDIDRIEARYLTDRDN